MQPRSHKFFSAVGYDQLLSDRTERRERERFAIDSQNRFGVIYHNLRADSSRRTIRETRFAKQQKGSVLAIDREHGVIKENRRARLEFARRMEQRRIEPNVPQADQIRRGWYFGAEDFLARLLDRLPGSVSEHHEARERNETDEERAEWMITARLKELRWARSELKTRRKGDRQKVCLARQLRRQTTVSLKWIAHRLEMGSWTYVSNLLRPARQAICVKSED